jgi:hypothetical protein
VPPSGFVPRMPKKIPMVCFLKDRLIRDFDARTPMIAQFDA